MIYIASGQYPLFSWHQIDNENQSTSQSPKIDFFTAEIRWDDKAKAAYSNCFGGVSHLVSKKLYPVLTSTLGKDLADNAQKDFAMENIQTLLELRSRTSAINDPKCLENLTFKATELLRHQFYRRFILGFLVAGHNIRVTLFSREGVFVGAPKDFRTTPLLVRCIVATLFTSNIELGLPPEGFFTYLSDEQKFSIALESAHTGKKPNFEILQQTQRPCLDNLIGRGTSVLKVKEQIRAMFTRLKQAALT